MSIPARVHFCWIGTALPWAYVFAVLSAAACGGLAEVILHHTDPLDDTAGMRALVAAGVQLSRVDAGACLAEAGAALGVGLRLAALYQGLPGPVMQSDVLRAAILFLQGGIYLDLDTVTVASLVPLLEGTQFVGCEFIVWPQFARVSRAPLLRARCLALDGMRKALRRLPRGWVVFRRVQGLYFRGVNNAVMGAQAGAPLLADYLRAMLGVTGVSQAGVYALGPHLLQQVVARYRGGDLTIHGPEVFCPLAPEISEHWFRMGRAAGLERVLTAQTRVVHWYASVRSKARVARIDPEYVRAHRDDQLYSRLVLACVPELAAPFRISNAPCRAQECAVP